MNLFTTSNLPLFNPSRPINSPQTTISKTSQFRFQTKKNPNFLSPLFNKATEIESPLMAERASIGFEDFLPTMADKLGGEGLMKELCNGFQLLVDENRGVITFESLKRKASTVLGLQGLGDGELSSMIEEGDVDGDGALNQMEFCVLMFRLSPGLMEHSELLLDEALQHEFDTAL